MSRRVILKTALSPDVARQRLRAAIDPPLAVWGSRPVRGSVGALTAGLTRQSRLNNAFRTRMGLVFEPQDERDGAGLILHGVSDIGLFGRLVLIVAATVLPAAGLMLALERGFGSPVPWLVMGGGLAGVGLVYGVGRALAQDDHDVLVRFLIQTLDARIVPTTHD